MTQDDQAMVIIKSLSQGLVEKFKEVVGEVAAQGGTETTGISISGIIKITTKILTMSAIR